MNNCPFLSNIEEKILCFKECAFYEFEASSEGCPFRKVKGYKALNLKDILSFDLEKSEEESYTESLYIKEYL